MLSIREKGPKERKLILESIFHTVWKGWRRKEEAIGLGISCNLRNMFEIFPYHTNMLFHRCQRNDESINRKEIYTSFDKFPLNCQTNGAS